MSLVDHVIVGGGTAGCVLAARLSEDPEVRVLLVEAGDREPATAPPLAWPTLPAGSACWGDVSVPQAATGAPVPVAQGRGLGGGSAINAMAHMRGHRSSYDAWVERAPGWGFDDLLPYFRRSERSVDHPGDERGHSGPTVVSGPAVRRPVVRAWLSAAAAAGFPIVDDRGAGTQEGFGWSEFAVVDGRRQSSADAYLRPVLDRPNLTVATGATVRRLLIERGRCIGVRYEQDRRTVDVVVDREVVLAAGAFASPQLLLLAGVGPREHLAAVGVPTRVDRAEVGANLQDHPLGTVVYRTPEPLPVEPSQPAGGASGLVRSSFAQDGPDLQFIVLDVPFSPSGQDVPQAGFSIGFSLMDPRSRGTVRLASADPARRPVVDPGYFSDPTDAAIMAEGLRTARRIGTGAPLAAWEPVDALPGSGVVGERAERRHVAEHSGPYNHYAGTCRMGADDAAVVDTALRVRGVDGLRVADSSVLPTLPSATINGTVLAIAERAADLLLDDRRRVPS